MRDPSDPKCKDGNARFTTVLLTYFLFKYEIESHTYNLENRLFSIVDFLLHEDMYEFKT